MKTLSAKALAEKVKDAVQIVWLLEVDADSPNAAATLYFGSRKYTLSTKVYTDSFVPDGLRVSWNRIKMGGGLASVATLQAAIRNEGVESNTGDTYFLENDEVRLYVSFVNADGDEEKSDAVQIARSVIEDTPFDIRNWVLDCIDGSDKDFQAFPRDLITLIEYPDAPFDALGLPLPWAVGALNVGPHDDAGAFAFLAPCRTTNGFLREYTAGKRCDAYGVAFQYYDHARRYAEIVNSTQSDETLTVTDGRREMRLYPVLPSGTNDVALYPRVMDGDNSTSVSVVGDDNLDVKIGGVPKLGTVISGLIQINAAGTFGYAILYKTVSIFSAGSVTGNQTITLSNFATDHADDWDFELYEVQIAGSASAAIKQIYLEVTFDDQLTTDRQELSIHQKVTGWEDLTTNYADGLVLSSSGAALDNPAHVLGAALRGKALLELPTANVDAAAVATAATARTGWSFRFSEDDTIDQIKWLNNFGFTAGMHIFMSFEGKWKMVAMEKDRTPDHAFLGTEHIAVANPEEPQHLWEPDIAFGKTPTRDIINDVVLKHRKDRGTGEYTALETATGRHRVTGTCSVVGSTGVLTDASAEFVTDGVGVGETAYVVGDKDYTVSAVTSETQLTLTHALGVNDANAGTTYYAGPNLTGAMKRSQLRYKTTNPLGEETRGFRAIGGFSSDLIGDSTTAGHFLTHLEEWRSERRYVIEFATFMNAINVELGDVAWFDHPWLPSSKRPIQLGTLTNAETDASTVFECSSGLCFREDDYLLVSDKEVVKVTAVATNGNLTVVRAQAQTVAIAHSAAAGLKRLNFVRWEVTGLKVDVEKAQVRIEMQEMPISYKPVGRCCPDDHPAYDAATAVERAQSGWCCLYSGRVEENDIYSAISHCGPDMGVY